MDELATDAVRFGVIGGSGLYELLDESRLVQVATPFGRPSAPVAVGSFGGRTVAFLARHGVGHTIPPHRVPYRANLWALASLGVRAVIASSAVGSITADLPADTFVVPDQLIDRTNGRADTYFEGPDVQHLGFADPFDPVVRTALCDALAARGDRFAATGTALVIPGPRFSTRAESQGWRQLGADILNMTMHPEAALAAELGIAYASLSFVTDADVGHAPGDDSVSAELVFRRLTAARDRITDTISDALALLPDEPRARALVDGAATARVLALPATI
ncbi:S-methyl-5'-thioinosine phosphorylase [Microbacterium sp. CPCC 204701]|uniref:S-methyl-5'-thioinosine phosphorylase n=1 Tax=Microbacterium sp. CPCC 204701 TaxID=2493084 RepID=UPI000FD8E6CF|nr:S-methyl-5'-thioinosine phosphorylase [Microbacterium sp. CPCC 204701]